MLTIKRDEKFADQLKSGHAAMMKGESYRALCLLAFSQAVIAECGWTPECGASPLSVFASAKANKILRAAKGKVLDTMLPGSKTLADGTFGSFLHASEQIAGLWPALYDGNLQGFEPTGEAGEVKLTNSTALRRAFQAMDEATAAQYKEKSGRAKGSDKGGDGETGATGGGSGGGAGEGETVGKAAAPGAIDVTVLMATLRGLADVDPNGLCELLGSVFTSEFLMHAAQYAEGVERAAGFAPTTVSAPESGAMTVAGAAL